MCRPQHAPRADAVGAVERESPEALRPDVVLDEAVDGRETPGKEIMTFSRCTYFRRKCE